MTQTSTLEVTTPSDVRTPSPRISTSRVLRSEWIKLRTLRSTWITAGALLLLIVGFGVIAALTVSGDMPSDPNQPGPPSMATDPVSTVLAGANFAVLIAAVFGAVVGAREYSTGMIRSSLSAVPRRLPVLWGKLASFGGVLAATVLAGVVVAFFAGMAVLDASGEATLGWGDDGVARVVLGTGWYVVGLGIMSVAFGFLLRGTAAAIGTVLGAVLFLPTLASALLPDSWDAVLKYLPSNAATAFTSLTSQADSLGIGAGFWVFTAWVIAAVAAAAVALVRRDA